MTKKNKIITIIAALVLGSLWAYCFSTRIKLLFVIPLWIKAIVMLGLGFNFSLLAYSLLQKFFSTIQNPKTALVLLIYSIILTGVVFIFAPYRNVPFRTTHQMQITSHDSTVEIIAIYSPDDNLIERDAFEANENVEIFADNGFRLLPGGALNYQRSQTGGLKVAIIANAGEVDLNWDGTLKVIDLSSITESNPFSGNGWRASVDYETGRIYVELPGFSWGKPDPFWTVLGGLLPIADFVSLASLLFAVFCLGKLLHQKQFNFQKNKAFIKAWADATISILLSTLLIHIGFPNFLPSFFLLFFIPAVIYLAYHQVQYLTQIQPLKFDSFSSFKRLLHRIAAFCNSLNHNKWVFWTLISIIVLAGAVSQIHLTAPGLGLSGDSIHYLEGARNMAAGSGYVRQIAKGGPVVMTGFPPVYSSVLLPAFWLGINIQQYARFLNTLLLVLTLVLAGLIVYRTSEKVMPAIFVSLFLVMSPAILRMYSWVMSEPLFIVLLLLNILLWFRQIEKPSPWKAILSGLMCGIMVNTRLAGIAFIPLLALGILIFQKTSVKSRLRDATLLCVLALLQPMAFFIRNSLVADRVSESRGLTLASFTRDYWEIIGNEIIDWFKWNNYFNLSHQQFNAMFASLAVIFLLTLGWIIFRKRLTDKHADPMIVLLLSSIPIYILLIILNTILLTPTQTESGLTRYMLPILLILFILLGKVLNVYWEQPILFTKLIIIFIVLIGAQLYFTDITALLQEQPFGWRQYTDRKNLCGGEVTSVLNAVETTQETSFYTNNCEYFYFMTGLLCKHLPLDESAYQLNSELYQNVESGDMVVFVDEFGTNPPGIEDFLADLTSFDEACYFKFYRLSEINK